MFTQGKQYDGTALLLQVEGVLEDGDGVLDDASLYDAHAFEGRAGQTVAITLESVEFDTFLLLRDGEGNELARNDDIDTEGYNYHSFISLTLPADGTYQIWANGLNATSRGRYRLTVVNTMPEQAVPTLSAAAQAQVEANHLLQQGIQQLNISQFQEALRSWEQALEIYREIGDRRGEGTALGNLGFAYQSLGDYRQAIDLHEQHLAIAREVGDREGEGRALGNLGFAYQSLGDYRQAIDLHEQALSILREIGDRRGEGTALGNLGSAYQSLGDYRQAIDLHEQHLAIAREVGDREGEGRALGNLGFAYQSLGDYRQAIDLHEQHLAIAREVGDREGEGRALGNLGFAYFSLGDYQRAIILNKQSLNIAHEMSNRRGEGFALRDLGNAHNRLGDYRQAIAFHEQSLDIFREIGDRDGEGTVLANLGDTYRGLGDYQRAIAFHEQSLYIFREIGALGSEGTVLGNLGIAYFSLGDYQQAIKFYEQHLAIAREIGDRSGEGRALANLGIAYQNLQQYDRAIDFYSQALPIFSALGSRAEEGITLSRIGDLFNLQNQPELAIVFLKASVDVRESIRGDIRGLDSSLQQSFTDTVAADYRLLADLLLQQDRILEAQRVLDLLKVQELDDYLRGVQRTAATAAGVDFLRPESAILAHHNEQIQSAIAVGQELATLQAVPPEQRTAAQTQRIAQLTALLDDINGDFRTFSRSPEVRELIDQLSFDAREASLSLGELDNLRDELKQLNAAIFYPLILEDRIELIITTPDSPPLRRTVNIPRTRLNDEILAFRTALTSGDPAITTPAQQLYDWLIRPLEADLQAAGVETIIYAPDGQLRYIPLAALHDGEGWLVQRYQVNNITARSLQDFTHTDSAAPRILAAAYADPTLIHRPTVNGTKYIFEGLPGAGQEVAALPNATTTFLDGAFSLAAVRPRMADHTILHFATHAAFVPGVPEDSFILFGNGDTPTLRDVETWTLNGVDLVVLSACETGVGGLGNGEEILGLGYQFQLSGARAVMSSLWKVSDQGTQVLMSAFYDALGQGMTKAEALQAAQKALITGDFSAVGGLRGEFDLVSNQTRQILPAEGSISHPYYWAPFILIGNGL
jgi:CHAT domain-containing protein/tetratricopeptide (TPR) repeat protein